MNRLKKSYGAEKATLADRFEQSVQADKLSHYDHLRDLKNQMAREEQHLEDSRRQIVGHKTEELNHSAVKTEQEGKERLRNLQKQLAAAEEYERKRGLAAEEEVRTGHKQSAEAIIAQSNKQIQTLQEDKAHAVDQAKETHATALNEIQAHYNGLRSSVSSQYQAELKTTQAQAAADLNERKLTNAVWIQQYSDRQNDPFYRMNRFDSELRESEDAYHLKVKVPEYERGQFHVQVSGQEVQLVGVRSNTEKAEVEPGRWISTATHQNVSERFALDHPVDGKMITMAAEGDYLEYTLPKFGKNHTYRQASDAKKGQRETEAVARALDFPNSLPKPTLSFDKSGKGTMA